MAWVASSPHFYQTSPPGMDLATALQEECEKCGLGKLDLTQTECVLSRPAFILRPLKRAKTDRL